MRQICLDVETTGLSLSNGDKIIEIGCVEIVNNEITGKIFHQYINPERDVPADAYNIHGISTKFLADKKKFFEIAPDLLHFIKNHDLIIHNAQFDLSFLNFELGQIKHDVIQNNVIDSLAIARKKFPGAKASLDALCRRFKIDTSGRKFHGALKDALLLSKVYLCLISAHQSTFQLKEHTSLVAFDRIFDKKELCVIKPSLSEINEREEFFKIFFG